MKRRAPLLVLPVLLWGCGTDVDGPVAPLLACAYGDVVTLSPSDVHQVTGEKGQTLCVGPDGSTSGDFLYIPFFGTPPGDGLQLGLDIEVAGTLSRPSAPSSSQRLGGPAQLRSEPEAGPPGPTGDPVFHEWLRRREIAELTPRIRSVRGADADAGPVADPDGRALGGGGTGGTGWAVAAELPAPGDLLELNVAISCSRSDIRTGRVERVSERAVLVADTANPAELSSFDYQIIAAAFDTLVHPVAAAHFGEAGDVDGNGRTILFFTRAVNELTPGDASTLTLGFFWSGDLFPAESTPRLEACPAANQAEILYLISPDPHGVAGPLITQERTRELIIPLIGHEIQHLANASRRLFVNDADAFEEPWLNEGLSHIAEELLFYRAAGLEPGANLSMADIQAVPGGASILRRYMWGNLWNLRRYMAEPDTASLMARDLLPTRGAAWSFLRYAADRSGRGDAAFFLDLVNGRTAGLDNLDRVLGAGNALAWMQDWTVSLYADDLLAGAAERFTQPSWELRSIYPGMDMGEYTLRTLPLSSTEPVAIELLPGGTGFTTFAVGADESAVLHVRADGTRRGSAVRGSVVRIR